MFECIAPRKTHSVAETERFGGVETERFGGPRTIGFQRVLWLHPKWSDEGFRGVRTCVSASTGNSVPLVVSA